MVLAFRKLLLSAKRVWDVGVRNTRIHPAAQVRADAGQAHPIRLNYGTAGGLGAREQSAN